MATNTASFPAIDMALAILSGILEARVERNGSAVQRKTAELPMKLKWLTFVDFHTFGGWVCMYST